MLFCEWRIDEQQLKLVENIRMLYDIISLILLSGLDPWPLDPLDPPKFFKDLLCFKKALKRKNIKK